MKKPDPKLYLKSHTNRDPIWMVFCLMMIFGIAVSVIGQIIKEGVVDLILLLALLLLFVLIRSVYRSFYHYETISIYDKSIELVRRSGRIKTIPIDQIKAVGADLNVGFSISTLRKTMIMLIYKLLGLDNQGKLLFYLENGKRVNFFSEIYDKEAEPMRDLIMQTIGVEEVYKIPEMFE